LHSTVCLPSKATKQKKKHSPWTQIDVAIQKQSIGEGIKYPTVIHSKQKKTAGQDSQADCSLDLLSE
jgi:hypothetical protein